MAPSHIQKPRPTQIKLSRIQIRSKQQSKPRASNGAGLRPHQKAAITRARNMAMQKGDYSSFVYKPEPPSVEPEIRHCTGWRYWWCCKCYSICWFPKNADVGSFTFCGSGRNLNAPYCHHDRCGDCKVESLEGEGWLWPGIAEDMARRFCDEPRPVIPITQLLLVGDAGNHLSSTARHEATARPGEGQGLMSIITGKIIGSFRQPIGYAQSC